MACLPASPHVAFLHMAQSLLIPAKTAMRAARAQRRVRPLLTEPPSRVTRVWGLMLKLVRVTDTIGSKARIKTSREDGALVTSSDVNMVVVQGVLQLSLLKPTL